MYSNNVIQLKNRKMIKDIKKAILNTNKDLTKLEQINQDRLIEDLETIVSNYSHLLSLYLASYQDNKKMSDKRYKELLFSTIDDNVDDLDDYDLEIDDIDNIYKD